MPTNPGTDNLVSWWAMESGALTVDSHGSNTLTDVNTVGEGAAKVGTGSGDFERDNAERFNIATPPADVSFGNESFSICAWIKLESAVQSHTVESLGAAPYSGYVCRVTVSGTTNLWLGGGQRVTHATALSLATWYFLVWQYDAAADLAGISIDGGALTTASYDGTGASANTTRPFVIGAWSGDRSSDYDGLMDEVCIFNKALTADEIAWLYNSGAGRAYSELAGGSALPIIRQAYHMARA